MTRYLSLAEYFWLAEQVTGVAGAVLAKSSRVDLADSALHAPAAGFGDEDFYPDLIDKAAVLTCRLACTEQAMFAVAAHEVDETWLAAWLRERVRAA